ncbi:MAG: putative transporter [Saprospiraceae bacterium]
MFDWFKILFSPTTNPDITQSLIAIFITIGLGVLFGRMKFKGVSLGVSAVMFIGLLLGHWGYAIEQNVSNFLRDFGLLMFVYAIGIQVGPSFFSSLKKEGLKFNMLSVGTVFLGGLVTVIVYKLAHLSIDNAVGLMSGSVTNTPGLGAATSTLHEISNLSDDKPYNNPATAYAITYPMGVIGIIFAIIFSKKWLKIDVQKELAELNYNDENSKDKVIRKKCRIYNSALFGKSIFKILKENDLDDVLITRVKHSGSEEVFTPSLDVRLYERDVVMVVGKPMAVKKFINLAGKESTDLLIEKDRDLISKFIYVSKKSASNKTLSELDLFNKYGLKVTRVYRSGMELLAHPSLRLFYGDMLRIVGNKEDIEDVEKIIGNSEKKLLEPDFLSLFGGLMLGIIIGSIPILIPSLPVPIKLGFAAGPLISALLISKYGGLGIIHSYINNGAIYFMKELGIALFFTSVGIKAGAHFYENFVENNGWLWLFYGSFITFIPIVIMVVIGYKVMKINYLQLVGLMSGTYTDPAALSFSQTYLKSDLPTQAYATVYPLVTIARIFVAQILIILFF